MDKFFSEDLNVLGGSNAENDTTRCEPQDLDLKVLTHTDDLISLPLQNEHTDSFQFCLDVPSHGNDTPLPVKVKASKRSRR
jgi:hypothetical protein